MSGLVRPQRREVLVRLDEDDAGLTFALPPKLESWLPEPKGSPAGRGQIEQWARSFLEHYSNLERLRGDFESTQGSVAHAAGTYLLELHGHRAWERLGYPDFRTFCAERLKLPERTATRLMFFARIATAQTASFGIRKCIAGVALTGALGVDGLEALLPRGTQKEPAAWAERLGEPVDFQRSSAARIEALVRRLAETPKLAEQAPSQRTRALVTRRKEVIERVAERHPVLGELEVKSFARDGEARISHRPATSPQQFAALGALYAALAKV